MDDATFSKADLEDTDDSEDSASFTEWFPSEWRHQKVNPFFIPRGKRKEEPPASVMLSHFTEFAFRMPTTDGLSYENFSFEGRRHMIPIYNTPARRIFLFCARQVEKSTFLGNKAVSLSCLIPGYKTLYVSPTSTQTKTFSNDRIKEPIETSPTLKSFAAHMMAQNIFEKQFNNFSKITLRNAFLNADRTRGIPAYMLECDEFQDLLSDNIPVIEQCTSHAPENLKQFIYAGTPKSLDNNIEFYRSGVARGQAMSTQGEWAVPCDSCGSTVKGGAGRFWNILGERNIGKDSLICEKCGKQIFPQHADAAWAHASPNAVFESYRISQLMVPWKPWEEITLDYRRYPRDKFFNEVLGLSFDSGLRPLSSAQVQACCNAQSTMTDEGMSKYEPPGYQNPVFAGIDWGTGENSYTVISLGTYAVGNTFRIFYIHRFEGQELEIPYQTELILNILEKFKVMIIGADYGGGFHMNDIITRKFGPQRLAKFQYMQRIRKKVEYDQKFRRYKVARSEVMSDIFNAIKRGNVIEFPRWEEFQEPYGKDFTNIFSEYNEQLRITQYNHRQDRTDDAFHSVLYCFLASMIRFPRPDVIAPLREDQHRGGIQSMYTGPLWQGLRTKKGPDDVVHLSSSAVGELDVGLLPSEREPAVDVRLPHQALSRVREHRDGHHGVGVVLHLLDGDCPECSVGAQQENHPWFLLLEVVPHEGQVRAVDPHDDLRPAHHVRWG